MLNGFLFTIGAGFGLIAFGLIVYAGACIIHAIIDN